MVESARSPPPAAPSGIVEDHGISLSTATNNVSLETPNADDSSDNSIATNNTDDAPSPVPGHDIDNSTGASDFGEDFLDTASITSSILEFQYENGRRYPSGRAGHYMMPNDETEQERLDLSHHIYLMLMGGKLFNAPITNPQKVLDLGTGTGIWAIDFADEYPEAIVIGNDLSPIQPSWLPQNCEFFIDDIEADWLEPPNTYDLIHSRNLAGCVADWPRLYRQAYEHLKPGGYFEVQESAVWAWSDDGSLKMDSPLARYLQALDDAGKKIGRELNVYKDLKRLLIDTGFEDVHERTYILPFSPWPKDPRQREIGRFQAHMVHNAVEAYGLRLCTQILGWSSDQTKILQALVRQQLKDPQMHSYTKIVVAYGRKPH